MFVKHLTNDNHQNQHQQQQKKIKNKRLQRANIMIFWASESCQCFFSSLLVNTIV